jgi:hypothetical protein
MVSGKIGNPVWNNDKGNFKKNKYFLQQWFSGLIEGIQGLDDETWPKILELTGRACARIHAVDLFQETWEKSKDLDSFLVNINSALGEKVFHRINTNQINATYEKCSCPLVALELVDSPILCNCSPSWLIENFETILDAHIEVTTEQTILRGSDTCNFTLTINP